MTVKKLPSKMAYVPHTAQEIVHASTATEKYLEWARRGGKSRSAIGELIKAIADWRKAERDGTRDPRANPPAFHAWCVMPTFPQGVQAWHELIEFLPKPWIQETNHTDKQFYLKSPVPGKYGFIEVKSAYDEQSLQTVGLDFLWVCESQDIPDEAIMKLRPTLRSPGRMRRAVFEGIPSLYRDHWFRKGCEAAQNDETGRRAYFHLTVYQNPMLTEQDIAEVEEDKELMPLASWERMYLARWSDNAGFFRGVQDCIAGDVLHDPLPGKTYVAGLDLAARRDATILTIFDMDERWVKGHYYWDMSTTNWPAVRDEIKVISDQWGLKQINADASALGVAMVDDMVDIGLPVEHISLVGVYRKEILGALAVAIERHTVFFPRIPTLIRQLQAFQHMRRGDSMVATAPAGEHDDEVFGLALGLMACNPAHVAAPTAPIRGGSSGRYVPTQKEAEAGGIANSFAKTLLQDRNTARRRESFAKAGVDY